MEPCFCGFGLGMSEMGCEGLSSAFEFFEEAFDGIPIPMSDVLESEAMSVAGRMQPRCLIDQEGRVIDEMFLLEFCKEHLGQCLSSGRKEPQM